MTAQKRTELEALAREIAVAEGLSLAAAREVAAQELAALLAYARSWDRVARPQRASAA